MKVQMSWRIRNSNICENMEYHCNQLNNVSVEVYKSKNSAKIMLTFSEANLGVLFGAIRNHKLVLCS